MDRCENRFDRGKPLFNATPQQLCDWLNTLARSIGIHKSPINPNGYECTLENLGK